VQTKTPEVTPWKKWIHPSLGTFNGERDAMVDMT